MNKVGIFNRAVKLKQRLRFGYNPEVQYLRDEVARRTVDRVSFINRDLSKLIDYGSGSSNFTNQLVEYKRDSSDIVKSKVKELWLLDSCRDLIERHPFDQLSIPIHRVVHDEETYQHPEAGYFDGLISNLSLHWCNDLPGVLKNINSCLKPDGMFMGSIFTTDTLFELRTSLQIAEMERLGGVSPHVSPLVRSEDLSSLLKQTGFELITIDVEEIQVAYPDLLSLMKDLQMMGESNALEGILDIKLSKDVLMACDSIYKTLHGEVDKDRIILPLTYRILFFICWKLLPSQPKPLQRGSATVNMKDVL